jgi:hypothetical protein
VCLAAGGAFKGWEWKRTPDSSRRFLIKAMYRRCQVGFAWKICIERGGRERPARFLDFLPVSTSKSQPYIEACPVQGANMNEFSTWVQNNWYSLGNLLGQFAFLAAGVWFARKILKTIRASQEQMGALLKLSLTDGFKSGATPHRPTPYVSADWPAAPEALPLSLPEPEPRRKRLEAAGRSVIRWLQTPMASQGNSPWRKVAHWLQAPAGS